MLSFSSLQDGFPDAASTHDSDLSVSMAATDAGASAAML